MIVVVRPHPAYFARLVERLQDKPVTYDELGQTKSTALPAGYHHQRATVAVGRGEAAWARARQALLTWQAHRRAGLSIYPPGAAIDAGAVVLATAHLGPVAVVLPCRVIYRTDEAERFGFAYGTLPGHPERGEEAFHVTLGPDGTVSFEVVAFSRPADLVTRLGGPLPRAAQAIATRRYLDGVNAYVSGEPGTGS
ncbi:MAG: DUF1990 family protein [Acidimicrobiales bacterium]